MSNRQMIFRLSIYAPVLPGISPLFWPADADTFMPQLQTYLPIKMPKELYAYGQRSSGETHGVVLTKPHIIDLILDLAGYTEDRDLTKIRLLEPSCGTGAFLVQAVKRLLRSAKRHGIKLGTANNYITAFDIDPEHVIASREAVENTLKEDGVSGIAARKLSESWINEEDFLLAALEPYDVIVGNPPYIRTEQISPRLQAEYRRRYASLYDRADLYVAFIERCLNLLKPKGIISFVCADRWILNRYGAPLRGIIAERFKVRCYIDLHNTSPFESDVIAYPAIFAISPGKSSSVHVARLETASPAECASVSAALCGINHSGKTPKIYRYETWFTGDEPWVLGHPDSLKALRKLESKFMPLETDGRAKVRIGLATGNDGIYIVDKDADIEPDRLIPLLMRSDINGGKIKNSGRFVINTFEPSGKAANLTRYPRLRKYLERHSNEIKRRHVAQNNPTAWFRTIDRVYPELVSAPKLIIPDIAGANEVVLDNGNFYPHHNLYYITSSVWDMEVLGGLLSSKVTLFFIWSYAVRMHGNYLRFQAQYLRRIRLPDPKDLSVELSQLIKTAFRNRDFAALDALALRAFQLDSLPEFDFVDTRR